MKSTKYNTELAKSDNMKSRISDDIQLAKSNNKISKKQ